MSKNATLYRMDMPEHKCPSGLKAKDLLERRGFDIDDRPLKSREETDAFKAEQGVETTPQIFIEGQRIGGFDDLQSHLGVETKDKDSLSYTPIIAIFSVAALMALASSFALFGNPLTLRAFELFIAFSMCILAIQKLQDIDAFANTFITYDLLAMRNIRYATVYPYAEAAAGILMIAGTWIGAPIALFIGGIGAVSVIKAVYIEKRDLKCACVGGDSNVPLGFVSLIENVMMVFMGLWMLGKTLL